MPVLDLSEELKKLHEETTTQVTGLLKELETKSGEERDKLGQEVEKLNKRLAKIEEKEEEAARFSIPGLPIGKAGEKDKYSLGRVVKLTFDPSLAGKKEYGLEVEVSKTLRDGFEQLDTSVKTAINAGSDGAGAWLIPTEMRNEIIPELEATSISQQLGVQYLTNATGGLIKWPKDQGGITAEYIDTEAEESGNESTTTFSTIELKPHTLGVFVPLTFSMMQQAPETLEPWLRRRMGSKLALREDRSVFTGISASSEPRGVYNIANKGTVDWTAAPLSGIKFGGGSGEVQNITNGLRAHVKALANSDAFEDATNLGWALSVEAAFAIANARDADGRPIFAELGEALPKTLMGYQQRMSTQLNSSKSWMTALGFANTNEWAAFGDWGRVINMHWGPLAFAASDETETNFRKLRRTLRMVWSHDIGVTHDQAFCFSSGFDTTQD